MGAKARCLCCPAQGKGASLAGRGLWSWRGSHVTHLSSLVLGMVPGHKGHKQNTVLSRTKSHQTRADVCDQDSGVTTSPGGLLPTCKVRSLCTAFACLYFYCIFLASLI